MRTATHLPAAVVIRSADAELIDFPDGSVMRLLADSSATGGKLSIHRTTLPAGAAGAGPHHHTRIAEVFYVLRGSVEILVDDEVVIAHEGDFASVPPGVAHAFGATPEGAAEVLVAITPGIDRFDLFRQVARVLAGNEPAGTLLTDQSPYDTYPDESAAWQQARHPQETP
jgi:quercetin dioxygenase-like cupin family protein